MTQEITITATSISPSSHSEDALMGHQLTEQYHRAVGAMREILKFGAMMMQLRDHLATVVQVRTTVGQFGEKPEGSIKRWLETNAPEVKSSTAFRFLHVAEAVAAEFQGPAKISFVDLATKPAEELPEKFRAKQSELWDFVDGTSQRSWLDRFAPAKLNGGYHPRQGEAPSIEEQIAVAKERAARDFRDLLRFVEAFAITKRKSGYDLLGDADKQIFRDLVFTLKETYLK